MAANATEQTSTAGTVIAGTVYAGTIEQLRRKSDGSRRVVFRTSSSTFDTQWPKWAYQIAMAAFLYDKQVQERYSKLRVIEKKKRQRAASNASW